MSEATDQELEWLSDLHHTVWDGDDEAVKLVRELIDKYGAALDVVAAAQRIRDTPRPDEPLKELLEVCRLVETLERFEEVVDE